MADYKQAIILRDDIDMSEGKRISQACHACLGSFQRSSEDQRTQWQAGGQKKVVLNVSGEQELLDLYRNAERNDLPCYLVRDAGETEVAEGAQTSLGIGPAAADRIDAVTGGLEAV